MVLPRDNQPQPASFLSRFTRDPAMAVPGAPVNFGRAVMPHIFSVASRVNVMSRNYPWFDEALRDSRGNAEAMRRETGIMECLEARQRGTSLLKWHIEPDGKSLEAKDLADQMTTILQKSWNFLEMRRNLLEALWYGRYMTTHQYKTKLIGGKYRQYISHWEPRHGDKLVFRYDDGSGSYYGDEVGIRVGGVWDMPNYDQVEVTSQFGRVYWLTGFEREMCAIHRHLIEDSDFYDYRGLGRIHGVGIRDRIYWCWYAMQECLANALDFIERNAHGIEIWRYPAGNPAAEERTIEAAENRSNKSILLVPVQPGELQDLQSVEVVEPGFAGLDSLMGIVRDYFGHKIKRYILGQTLSSEAESTGLGSGVADAHLATLADIIQYDAIKLEETITDDLLLPLQKFNFPRSMHIGLTFRLDTEADDMESKLAAFQAAYEMGARLPATDVMAMIGARIPDQDEEVLSQAAQAQQQLDMQQQQMAMQGGPQGPGGPGGEGEDDSGNPPPGSPGGPWTPSPTTTFGPMGDGGGGGGPPVDLAQPGTPHKYRATWKEEEHPRAEDGEFATKAQQRGGKPAGGKSRENPFFAMRDEIVKPEWKVDHRYPTVRSCSFELKDGRQFECRAYGGPLAGDLEKAFEPHLSASDASRMQVADFVFTDDEGSTGATGKGSTREIFRHVLGAVQGLMERGEHDAIEFTGGTRHHDDLYAFLMQFEGKRQDKYTPLELQRYAGARPTFVLLKKELADKVLAGVDEAPSVDRAQLRRIEDVASETMDFLETLPTQAFLTGTDVQEAAQDIRIPVEQWTEQALDSRSNELAVLVDDIRVAFYDEDEVTPDLVSRLSEWGIVAKGDKIDQGVLRQARDKATDLLNAARYAQDAFSNATHYAGQFIESMRTEIQNAIEGAQVGDLDTLHDAVDEAWRASHTYGAHEYLGKLSAMVDELPRGGRAEHSDVIIKKYRSEGDPVRYTAAWDEAEHPRKDDGQFTEKGRGKSGGKKAAPQFAIRDAKVPADKDWTRAAGSMYYSIDSPTGEYEIGYDHNPHYCDERHPFTKVRNALLATRLLDADRDDMGMVYFKHGETGYAKPEGSGVHNAVAVYEHVFGAVLSLAQQEKAVIGFMPINASLRKLYDTMCRNMPKEITDKYMAIKVVPKDNEDDQLVALVRKDVADKLDLDEMFREGVDTEKAVESLVERINDATDTTAAMMTSDDLDIKRSMIEGADRVQDLIWNNMDDDDTNWSQLSTHVRNAYDKWAYHIDDQILEDYDLPAGVSDADENEISPNDVVASLKRMKEELTPDVDEAAETEEFVQEIRSRSENLTWSLERGYFDQADSERRELMRFVSTTMAYDDFKWLEDEELENLGSGYALTKYQATGQPIRYAAVWDESQHPRDKGGEFTAGSGERAVAAGGPAPSPTPKRQIPAKHRTAKNLALSRKMEARQHMRPAMQIGYLMVDQGRRVPPPIWKQLSEPERREIRSYRAHHAMRHMLSNLGTSAAIIGGSALLERSLSKIGMAPEGAQKLGEEALDHLTKLHAQLNDGETSVVKMPIEHWNKSGKDVSATRERMQETVHAYLVTLFGRSNVRSADIDANGNLTWVVRKRGNAVPLPPDQDPDAYPPVDPQTFGLPAPDEPYRASQRCDWMATVTRYGVVWDEDKHPRADDGKFSKQAGIGGPEGEEAAREQQGTKFSARPDFMKWFKGSTVVDHAGNPKIVYHGGHKPPSDFSEGSVRGFGLAYFTDDPRAAGDYAMTGGPLGAIRGDRDDDDDDDGDSEGSSFRSRSPGIVPAYLKIEKPATDANSIQDLFDSREEAEPFLFDWSPDLRDAVDAAEHDDGPMSDDDFWDLVDSLTGDAFIENDNLAMSSSPGLRAMLSLAASSPELFDRVHEKFDGLIYDDEETGATTYVVFDPTQIKSATGNRGTFDPEDPDIRFGAKKQQPVRHSVPAGGSRSVTLQPADPAGAARYSAAWDESEHPRDDDGQFKKGSGSAPKFAARGEYWIQNQRAVEANSNFGQGHADHVVDALQEEAAELLDMKWEQFYEPENKDDIIRKLVDKHGWSREKAECTFNEGDYDPRMIGLQEWGWHRVQDDNVMTDKVTRDSLSQIADGLWDAHGDEVENEKFTIEDYSHKKLYTDVPYGVIADANPAKLREYQQHFSARRRIGDADGPDDEPEDIVDELHEAISPGRIEQYDDLLTGSQGYLYRGGKLQPIKGQHSDTVGPIADAVQAGAVRIRDHGSFVAFQGRSKASVDAAIKAYVRDVGVPKKITAEWPGRYHEDYQGGGAGTKAVSGSGGAKKSTKILADIDRFYAGETPKPSRRDQTDMRYERYAGPDGATLSRYESSDQWDEAKHPRDESGKFKHGTGAARKGDKRAQFVAGVHDHIWPFRMGPKDLHARLSRLGLVQGSRIERHGSSCLVRIPGREPILVRLEHPGELLRMWRANPLAAQESSEAGGGGTAPVGVYRQGEIILAADVSSGEMSHELIHAMQDLGIVSDKEVALFGGREQMAYAYQRWVDVGRPKHNIFQRMYAFISSFFGSKTAKRQRLLERLDAGKQIKYAQQEIKTSSLFKAACAATGVNLAWEVMAPKLFPTARKIDPRVPESGLYTDGTFNISDIQFATRDWKRWMDAARVDPRFQKVFRKKDLDHLESMMASNAVLMSSLAAKDMLPEELKGNPLRKNADFFFSQDFSTVCPNQDAYVDMLLSLQKVTGNVLSPEQRYLVGKAMGHMDMQTVCEMCYGQASRDNGALIVLNAAELLPRIREAINSGEYARMRNIQDPDERKNLLNKLFRPTREGVKPWSHTNQNPNSPNFGKLSGFAQYCENHANDPEHQKIWEEHLDRVYELQLGYGDPPKNDVERAIKKAISAVTITTNLPKGWASMEKQILRLKPERVKQLNGHAGLRMQSQTDFRPWHVTDIQQGLMQMEAVKLGGHAYTRQPDFTELIGDTGVKINGSMMYAKDRNGEMIRDEDGWPVWDMNSYPKHIAKEHAARFPHFGNVCIPINVPQIVMSLDDPNVHQAIPLHTASMPRWAAEDMGGTDFSAFQHEHWPEDRYGTKKQAKDAKPLRITLSGGRKVLIKPHGLITQVHHRNDKQDYLDICEQLGIVPKFPQLCGRRDLVWDPNAEAQHALNSINIDHPNYMRLISDYARTDTPFGPPKAVKFNHEAGNQILEHYLREGHARSQQGKDPRYVEEMIARLGNNEWPDDRFKQACEDQGLVKMFSDLAAEHKGRWDRPAPKASSGLPILGQHSARRARDRTVQRYAATMTREFQRMFRW